MRYRIFFNRYNPLIISVVLDRPTGAECADHDGREVRPKVRVPVQDALEAIEDIACTVCSQVDPTICIILRPGRCWETLERHVIETIRHCYDPEGTALNMSQLSRSLRSYISHL